MRPYRQVFTNRHVVLPVVHVDSLEQAKRNAQLARDAGADGVFLINHGMSHAQLLQIHGFVSGELPGWWIGVNCLGLPPAETFSKLKDEVAGVWVDNAMIDERLGSERSRFDLIEQPDDAIRKAMEWVEEARR